MGHDLILLGFQSTSPVRGTTSCQLNLFPHTGISIHVPREGDDYCLRRPRRLQRISIHVPREGDDLKSAALPLGTGYFNPRPP